MKVKHWLPIILMLGFANMASAQSIEDACKALVVDYAIYRDQGDADALGNLFTLDATLSVMGNEVLGREKIRDRVTAGIGGPVFRHLMSTIKITPDDDNHASGVSYATVYASPPGQLPLALKDFAAIGEYHDKFVRTKTGWKIQQRKFVPVFLPPTEEQD